MKGQSPNTASIHSGGEWLIDEGKGKGEGGIAEMGAGMKGQSPDTCLGGGERE